MQVIGLERGPRLKTEDFAPQDELRYFQRQDLRPDPKRQPVTWRTNANSRVTPIPSQSYGNQAGGGTVHYGAVSWRFHEDDFRVRSQTIERYGAAAIPEDSSVIDWPLSYAELEPITIASSAWWRVGQGRQSAGRKIDSGNVSARRAGTVSAAAAATRSGGHHLRRRGTKARLSPVLDTARHPVTALCGPAGVRLCGFCRVLAPHQGQV
jgi:gluconate 2-dehydrogenase alpha chain